MGKEKLHTGHFALPRTTIYDLLAALALKKVTLRQWVTDAIEAGIKSPPSFAMKPDIQSMEPFRLPITDAVLHGCWDLATSWTENSGERVVAQDVMIVLLVRQARADIAEAKAQHADDHYFLSHQFAAFRDPSEDHDPEAIKAFNRLLEGVECNFVAMLPRRWIDEEAQAKQNAEREAVQKRMTEKQMADAVARNEERNRLSKLLAGAA